MNYKTSVMKHRTSVTISNEHGVYSVSVDRTEVGLDELVDDVITPALLSAGYAEATVKDFLGGRISSRVLPRYDL